MAVQQATHRIGAQACTATAVMEKLGQQVVEDIQIYGEGKRGLTLIVMDVMVVSEGVLGLERQIRGGQWMGVGEDNDFWGISLRAKIEPACLN